MVRCSVALIFGSVLFSFFKSIYLIKNLYLQTYKTFYLMCNSISPNVLVSSRWCFCGPLLRLSLVMCTEDKPLRQQILLCGCVWVNKVCGFPCKSMKSEQLINYNTLWTLFIFSFFAGVYNLCLCVDKCRQDKNKKFGFFLVWNALIWDAAVQHQSWRSKSS